MQHGKIRKNTVCGKQCFLQPLRVPKFLQLCKCQGICQLEFPDSGTNEALHGAAAAQFFPNIGTETADIGSLGTFHAEFYHGKLYFQNLDCRQIHMSCLPFHFFARSGQLIELFPIDLQCRIHGWDLVIAADKTGDHFTYLCFTHRHFPLFQNGSRDILGICDLSQQKFCHIFLGPVRQHFTCSGSIPQTYRKHTGSLWIQCTCVPYLFLPADPAKLGYHIMGGKARFLIYIDDAVH